MEIKSCIARDVCYRSNDPDELVPWDDWEFVESKITGNDTDDGGASYEAIIQNNNDAQFYKVHYNDWDFYWEYTDWKEDEDEDSPTQGRTIDDGNTMTIYPVTPKKVTIITYE